jgi:predicted NBD/HSP70 family sugar kinase
MAYFVGLDVSVKETSVCIVDDAGKIVREARVASERRRRTADTTRPPRRGMLRSYSITHGVR